jgi:predicted nucleotidyltransferase
MFTVDRRQQVRTQLLARAGEDERIVGAAITGSAATDGEDRWSDIDLFFGVAQGVEVTTILSDWSLFVYSELGAIHHFDLSAGAATYRAFLLDELLEVDLAFTPLPNSERSEPEVFESSSVKQCRVRLAPLIRDT